MNGDIFIMKVNQPVVARPNCYQADDTAVAPHQGGKIKNLISALALLLQDVKSTKMPMKREASPNITVDKAALRERLTPVEYQVTQEKGTERYVPQI